MSFQFVHQLSLLGRRGGQKAPLPHLSPQQLQIGRRMALDDSDFSEGIDFVLVARDTNTADECDILWMCLNQVAKSETTQRTRRNLDLDAHASGTCRGARCEATWTSACNRPHEHKHTTPAARRKRLGTPQSVSQKTPEESQLAGTCKSQSRSVRRALR